jgi:NTP pyrophosphatase (non-canonical NTP hydrolase)
MTGQEEQIYDVETLEQLMRTAEDIERCILAEGWGPDISLQQALALAEEAGEFVGAFRRFKGLARRPGNFAAMAEELADVVITAFVTAITLDINLPTEINYKLSTLYRRGWRQRETTNVLMSPAIETNEARNAE